MRAIAAVALTSVAALAVAGLSAATVQGAGSDGLTRDSLLKSADFSGAFSGGAATSRVPDDPDAPIRTSRFDDAPTAPAGPVQLAGAAPLAPELAGAAPLVAPRQTAPIVLASADAPPAPATVTLARVAPVPARRPSASRAYAALGMEGSALRPATTGGLLAAPRRLSLSITTDESPLSPGSGLAFAARDDRESPAAARIPAKSKLFDAKRLGLQLDLAPHQSKSGRWFIFAATSGDAFGFNLFGDPAKSGGKRSGWSVEKLVEYGKAQLGVGWRKGPMQVSVAATQREVGAYGYSQEDTVLGVSFTVSGGKRLPPPKARRGLPRE